MSTFAVVPVKSLLKSKTRLANSFTVKDRSLFTLAMLEDVLSALKASKIGQTVVVGSDSSVEDFVKNFGITFLREIQEGLNQALNQAIRWCIRNQAEAVLVLPADVPLVTPKDLDTMVKLALKDCLVISPSRNGGTNALLLSPPSITSPSFGVDSFKIHVKKAQAKKIRTKIYVSANVMMDIDSEADLERLVKTGRQTASCRFLKQSSWCSSQGAV